MMTNEHNLAAADVAAIEALTAEQLIAIRRNTRTETDDDAREALAQALADGYDIEDFIL